MASESARGERVQRLRVVLQTARHQPPEEHEEGFDPGTTQGRDRRS